LDVFASVGVGHLVTSAWLPGVAQAANGQPAGPHTGLEPR